MNEKQMVLEEFENWIGYLEKNGDAKMKPLGLRNSDPFQEGAGSKNYTIFAQEYAIQTGIKVQAQPWCDVFVDMMFICTFGIARARDLLGGFSAYTPDSANRFKSMGSYYTEDPRAGDVIFFLNSERICHTGIVTKVSAGRIFTIEGNTSSEYGVVPNGGAVRSKSYALTYAGIAGFGRPAYKEAEGIPESWLKWRSFQKPTGTVWKYRKADGSYARNAYMAIDGLRYYFNEAGEMVTGQVYLGNERHVFMKQTVLGAEFAIDDSMERIIEEG